MTHPHLIRIPKAALEQALELVERSYQQALDEAYRHGWLPGYAVPTIKSRANDLIEAGASEIGKDLD